MSQDELRKAFALMKQGDKRQAAQVVQAVIKQDRNSVPAWWMMANVLDDPMKKQKALEKVLSLDANHAGAKKMLASLGGTTATERQAPRSPQPTPAQNSEAKTTAELEFDWGKLDKRDSKKKKKDVPEASEDKAIKMASYIMGALVLVVMIAAIILVVIPGFKNTQTASTIEKNMTDFLDAMVVGDFTTAENFVCAQYRRDQGRTYFFALGLQPLNRTASFDVSRIKIKVSDFTDTGAVANLSGNVRVIPTEGEPEILSVDDIMGDEGFDYGTTSFEFILENDQWLICDKSFKNG